MNFSEAFVNVSHINCGVVVCASKVIKFCFTTVLISFFSLSVSFFFGFAGVVRYAVLLLVRWGRVVFCVGNFCTSSIFWWPDKSTSESSSAP